MALGSARRDLLAGRRPRPIVVAVGLAVALVAIMTVVASTPQGSRWNGDVKFYLSSAVAFLEGTLSTATSPQLPPFLHSYLPLSLLPMLPPLAISRDLPLYAFAFGVEMCALAGLGVLLVAPVARRTVTNRAGMGPVGTYAAFALLCAFVIPLRFDMFPSILVLGAITAASGGQALVAGLLLGAGAAVKLYPAAVLPALIGWYWFRSERGSVLQAIAGFALAAGVGLSLYVAFPDSNLFDVVRVQAGRGLELESVAGSVVAALAAVGLIPGPTVAFADGSFNLAGAGVDGALRALALLQPLVLLAALGAVALRFWLDGRDRTIGWEHLSHGAALLTVALIVTNRVLSPQYMIWLLPLVPFLGWRHRLVALVAAGFTLLIFPFLYDPVINLDGGAVLLLLARNLALVLLLGLLAVDLIAGTLRASGGRDQEPASDPAIRPIES